MKKIVLCVFLIAVVTGGALFSQNRRGPGADQGMGPGAAQRPGTAQRAAPEKITVSGNLGIAGGHIAIQDGDKTYHVMGLNRFIGFIDGLKEGASVQLEGYNMPNRNRNSGSSSLRVTKLTMNGKTYDLDQGSGNFMGNRHPGGNGPGFGGNNVPQMNNRMMPFQQPHMPQMPQQQGRR